MRLPLKPAQTNFQTPKSTLKLIEIFYANLLSRTFR